MSLGASGPRKQVVACLLTLLVGACITSTRSTGVSPAAAAHDEQAVLQVLAEWIDALRRADVPKLKQIVAEDYLITVAGGRVLNREQDLEPIVKGTLHFESAKTDSVRVRVFGDAAVVTGIGIYVVKMGDKTSTIRERFTDVYARRNGKWQPVASHSTPLR